MDVAFLAPDTVAEHLLEPHPHTNNTHPHFFIPAHIRLRTARKTYNSMQMAEGALEPKSIMLTLFEKLAYAKTLRLPYALRYDAYA